MGEVTIKLYGKFIDIANSASTTPSSIQQQQTSLSLNADITRATLDNFISQIQSFRNANPNIQVAIIYKESD